MCKKPEDLPEVTELNESDVDEIIRALENSSLDPSVKRIAIKCVELALWLPGLLQRKNISLHRLRRLIFGKGYKAGKKRSDKDNKDQPGNDDDPNNASGTDDANDTDNSSTKDNETTADDEQSSLSPVEANAMTNQQQLVTNDTEKKPGHGRMASSVYADVEELVYVGLDGLQRGDLCPEQCGGRLAKYGAGTVIRVKGQNFAKVLHYVVEKLRCSLCGIIVTAQLPIDAGDEKYDNSFKAMLSIQKYYVAVPFNRQEYFQALLGFPLPNSTQWELVEKVAQSCYAPFQALQELAANGKLIYHDDTSLKILEHIKQIKADSPERTGMFTTCILGEHEGHPICLFFNGVKYSGENVDDLLSLRDADKQPILQMCDGLIQQNTAKNSETILCNCMSHGFRKFEELHDYYPEECGTIMHYIGEFYTIDKATVDMSDEKRLVHHQTHSQPVANQLFTYMSGLLEQHLVEPNCELGGAIKYMQKRWDKLTRFLTVAGAPLDNNIAERAIKIPIRNRQAAGFYRTQYSAHIGGMLTSLIYTCQLVKENAHHYLTVLQDYQRQVTLSPRRWLPWNYQVTLAALEAT